MIARHDERGGQRVCRSRAGARDTPGDARVIPYCPGVAIPLEDGQIEWLR